MSITIEDILEDKVIEVKPILRGNTYIKEDHDGAGIYTGCTWSANLVEDRIRKQFVPIFTREEREVVELELNKKPGELDFYDRNNAFWTSFRVLLTKEGLRLNLRNIEDVIKYRILKADPRIAKSWATRLEDGQYKWALVEPDYEVAEINKKQDKTRRAYKAFGKIEDSINKMSDVLAIYGKKVPKNVRLDWLQAEIGKMIDDKDKIEEFLTIVEDPNYETRLLITNAIEIGALIRSGKTGFRLPGMEEGKEYVADNLSEMIDYLKNPKNQPTVLKIKGQLSASK